LELVELLLAAVADPTATSTKAEWSVLHLARRAAVLRYLLQLGLPLECRHRDGYTPLLHACFDISDLDCVEVLLAAGADIHATDNEGRGVLHCSAFPNTPEEFIRLLLDHGKAIGRPLNVNAPDKTGATPLMAAAWWVAPLMVKTLLAAGADVKAVDISIRAGLRFITLVDPKLMRLLSQSWSRYTSS